MKQEEGYGSHENYAYISGYFVSGKHFQFGVVRSGQVFYNATLTVKRRSGIEDQIPVAAPKEMVEGISKSGEVPIMVCGRFVSYLTKNSNAPKRHVLYLLAEEVQEMQREELTESNNYISLSGELYKDPHFRLTPKGRRITDFMLYVQPKGQKAAIIPCIMWEDLAVLVSQQAKKGTKVNLLGRIQSREYTKSNGKESDPILITTYEVSGSWIDFIED